MPAWLEGRVDDLVTMLYDRSGVRYRATGRDFWVFQDRDGQWVGIWRTMFDVEEIAA